MTYVIPVVNSGIMKRHLLAINPNIGPINFYVSLRNIEVVVPYITTVFGRISFAIGCVYLPWRNAIRHEQQNKM